MSIERRRHQSLQGTAAAGLRTEEIDSLELLIILRPLSPKVVYDIGANVGTWTRLAKAIFPDASIQAFEPLASHAERFKQNTCTLKNVHLHEVALGPVAGTRELKITNQSDSSSFLGLTPTGSKRFHLKQASCSDVKVERLDDFAMLNGLAKPDLLKLDVQGFELGVLRGSTKCLEAAMAVVTEVSFQEFYHGQCLFHEIVAALTEFDFNLCAFGHGTKADRVLTQTDALFVKSEMFETLHAG
jgi:FkbM family methyltransferase